MTAVLTYSTVCMLYRVVLTFKSVDKALYCATIQLEAVEHLLFSPFERIKKKVFALEFLETIQCSFNFFSVFRFLGCDIFRSCNPEKKNCFVPRM